MKAKHHKAISRTAQCMQGLLIIPLFIAGASLGEVDITNDMNEVWIVVYKVLGNLLYILIAMLILEFLRRYSIFMYRLTRAQERLEARENEKA